MRKRRSLIAVPIVLVAAGVHAQGPTGREVMEAYSEQDRTEDTAVEMRMSIVGSRGGMRERRVAQWTKTLPDDSRMQLIRFLSPADVEGTGFLSIENLDGEDDNWLYLPALRKTRRIAGTDKRESFVGTDFSYEDLEAERLDEYRYEVVGTEALDGVEAWIVEAVPTDRENVEVTAYGRRELWVSRDHAVILQAKYYDEDGTYVKRFRAEDVRQVEGTDKWRAHRLTMEDIQDGGRTVLEIAEYRIDQGVTEEYFTQRYLRRGR